MPSKPEHLYEYSVIRFVPRVEREEFINIGLIMMCKRRKWIRVEIYIPDQRLCAFSSAIDRCQLMKQLENFVCIANGERSGGPMAEMVVEERFRWLTAVRSACIQTSRPHPGLTDNLDLTFNSLFEELVK